VSLVFVVPRGAEASAVRRGSGAVPLVEIRAGAAAARALPAFERGATVIVLGLCGALRERRAGEVVVYRELAEADALMQLDKPLVDAALAALPAAHAVRGCTTDHVVTRAVERAPIAQRFAADVVDMESDALAAALGAQQVRFAIVRVVSDDPTRDLPALEHAIGPDGTLRPLRIAAAFLRDPRGAAAFARDAQRALRTLATVAHALSSLTA
jgi:nucleoside phosphorylase